MTDPYSRRILDHISDRRYQPRRINQLAKDLGIVPDQIEPFRRSVAQLVEQGQAILGSFDTLTLPPPGPEMTGTFRLNQRGFGFLEPDTLTEHGDLFVPAGNTGGAMTGDRVQAKVIHRPQRSAGAHRSPYIGRVVLILQRADKHYTGTLRKRGRGWVVEVDGKLLAQPVVIRDPHARGAKPGDKTVIELITYPSDDQPPEGVILEVLGQAGEPATETLAVIRAYHLSDRFPQPVIEEARAAAQRFDTAAVPRDRLDLTDQLLLTIDPPDAKDFDDAISLRRLDRSAEPDGAAYELGVHIADVSYFVQPDGALDFEAYQRGNSAYLPRHVVPMLPELLSNGLCSLQEGVRRFAKSAMIRYDDRGHVLDERVANTVIHSAKRLTYLEAQALIDGDASAAAKHAVTEPHYTPSVTAALQLMDQLAKRLRRRRLKQGMITLELPEVELIFDDTGRISDAVPEDNAFTHTIIEMFMVEANEAVARLFHRQGVPMIRRIHPDPDAYDLEVLRQYAKVAGLTVPKHPTRAQLQALLASVHGKPTQHPVHLAVLKTLSKAEYSPATIGHFALASEHYTHFTSPIRRYPDLVVHRALDAYLLGELDTHTSVIPTDTDLEPPPPDRPRETPHTPKPSQEEALTKIGRHCSKTERNAESAERQLRSYFVLELLSHHLGEDFDGTITGVTSTGVYIQIDRYLIDGFTPVAELPVPPASNTPPKSRHRPQDRWKLNRTTGVLIHPGSGRTLKLGDRLTVRVVKVNPPARQLDLAIVDGDHPTPRRQPRPVAKSPRSPARRRSTRKKR